MVMANPMAKRRHGKPIMSDLASFMEEARSYLNQLYILSDCGTEVEGQSFSYFIKHLRQYEGWQFPGRSDDRHEALEILGFKIADGRNDRGNRSEVVYLEDANKAVLAATELRLEKL